MIFELKNLTEEQPRLAETFGMVEANDNEQHELYFKLQSYGYKVEQVTEGIRLHVGMFMDHQVHVAFNWMKVNGTLIGFYYPTSRVVDFDVVEGWIKANMPHVKHKSDATNIHNVLHGLGIEQDPNYVHKNTRAFLEKRHSDALKNLERFTGEIEKIEREKSTLHNVLRYAKNWYQKSGDVWADVQKCLEADDYMPGTREDVLNIIMNTCTRYFHGRSEYVLGQFVDAIKPGETWKYGYYHKDCNLSNNESTAEFDHTTAILHFFLSKLHFLSQKEIGCELKDADPKVLPLKSQEPQVSALGVWVK